MDANTIAAIGVVITALGVLVAVATIIYTAILAKRQKDLETLLQLSNHHTGWHDAVLGVTSRYDEQRGAAFQRRMKYQGPLNIYLALLGAHKKFRVFKKYDDVIKTARCFESKALEEKGVARKPLGDCSPLSLTDAYSDAMKAISAKAEKL